LQFEEPKNNLKKKKNLKKNWLKQKTLTVPQL